MGLLVIIGGAVILSAISLGIGMLFMSGASKNEKELKGERYYE